MTFHEMVDAVLNYLHSNKEFEEWNQVLVVVDVVAVVAVAVVVVRQPDILEEEDAAAVAQQAEEFLQSFLVVGVVDILIGKYICLSKWKSCYFPNRRKISGNF